MRDLPTCLSLGGAAVHRLPLPNNIYFPGASWLPYQPQEPTRTGKALWRPDNPATRPILHLSEYLRRSVPNDDVGTQMTVNQISGPTDSGNQLGANPIREESIAG
jgi:hypothetical protein